MTNQQLHRRVPGAALCALVIAATACASSAPSEAATAAPTVIVTPPGQRDPSPTAPPVSAPTKTTPPSAVATTSAAPERCEGDPIGPSDRRSLSVDSADRTYLVSVPATAAYQRRLLVDLHGHGGNAADHDANTGMSAAGTANSYVVITPDALGTPARWNFDHRDGEADDYHYLRTLIDDALTTYCVDTGDVVLVGSSNGAAFAGLYGCTDDRVNAIAMVIATTPDTCPAERIHHPAIITIRGTADTTVPYRDVPELLATWATGARCAAAPTTETPWPGVERTIHNGCEDGQQMVLDTILDGVHTWPGGLIAERPDNSEAGATYPSTQAILGFFDSAFDG